MCVCVCISAYLVSVLKHSAAGPWKEEPQNHGRTGAKSKYDFNGAVLDLASDALSEARWKNHNLQTHSERLESKIPEGPDTSLLGS